MKNMAPAPDRPADVPGWAFISLKTNIFISCSVCKKVKHEFFFRHVRNATGDGLKTEAKCGPCLWKSGDGKSGPKKLEWEEVKK